MPDKNNIYSPASVATGIDTNAEFLLELDTKQRFDNIANQFKSPIQYKVPDFGVLPSKEGLSFNDLINPEVNSEALKNGMLSDDYETKQKAWGIYADKYYSTPEGKGVGGYDVYKKEEWQNKYLNDKFGLNPNVSQQRNEEIYYDDYLSKPFYSKIASNVTKGVTRVVSGALLKFGQGLGYMGGIATSGFENIGDLVTGRDDHNFFDTVANNVLARSLEDLETKMKDSSLLSVYKPNDWDGRGFFSQLKNAAYWTDEIADGAAFLLSAAIPGGAIGRAGKGVSLLINGTSKFAKLMKSAQVALSLETLGDVGSVVYNTASEAAFEGAGVYKNVSTRLREERDKGLNTFTDEEIRRQAGDQASKNFRANLAILSASSIYENKFFFKPIADRLSGVSRLVKAGVEDAGKIAEVNTARAAVEATESVAAKNATFFGEASLLKKGKGVFNKLVGRLENGTLDPNARFSFYGSRFSKAIAMEGFWEENAQLASERVTSSSIYKNGDGEEQESSDSFLYQLARQTKNAIMGNDPEAAKSIGAGGVIGVLGGGLTAKFMGSRSSDSPALKWYTGERRATRFYAEEAVKSYNEAARNFLSTHDIFKRDEKGEIIKDPITKEAVIDKEKVQAKIDYLQKFGYEQIKAEHIQNEAFRNKLQADSFARYMGAAIRAGLSEKLLDKINSLSSLSKEQVLNLGFDPDSIKIDFPKFVKRANDLVQQYHDIYTTSVNRPKEKSLDKFNKDEDARKFTAYMTFARKLSSKDAEDYYTPLVDAERAQRATSMFATESAPMHSAIDLYNDLVHEEKALVLAKNDFNTSKLTLHDEFIDKRLKVIRDEKKKLRKQIDEFPTAKMRIHESRGFLLDRNRYTSFNIQTNKFDDGDDRLEQDQYNSSKKIQLKLTANLEDNLFLKLTNVEKGHNNYEEYTNYLITRAQLDLDADDKQASDEESAKILKKEKEDLEKIKNPLDTSKIEEAEVVGEETPTEETPEEETPGTDVLDEDEKLILLERLDEAQTTEEMASILKDEALTKFLNLPENAELKNKYSSKFDRLKEEELDDRDYELEQIEKRRLEKEEALGSLEENPDAIDDVTEEEDENPEETYVVEQDEENPGNDSLSLEENNVEEVFNSNKALAIFSKNKTVSRAIKEDYPKDDDEEVTLNEDEYDTILNKWITDNDLISANYIFSFELDSKADIESRMLDEERRNKALNHVGQVVFVRDSKGKKLTLGEVMLKDNPKHKYFDSPIAFSINIDAFNRYFDERVSLYAKKNKITEDEAREYYKIQTEQQSFVRDHLINSRFDAFNVKVVHQSDGVYETTNSYSKVHKRFRNGDSTALKGVMILKEDKIVHGTKFSKGKIIALIERNGKTQAIAVSMPKIGNLETELGTQIKNAIEYNYIRKYDSKKEAMEMINNFYKKVFYVSPGIARLVVYKDGDKFRIGYEKYNEQSSLYDKIGIDQLMSVRLNANESLLNDKTLNLPISNEESIAITNSAYTELLENNIETNRRAVKDHTGNFHFKNVSAYFAFEFDLDRSGNPEGLHFNRKIQKSYFTTHIDSVTGRERNMRVDMLEKGKGFLLYEIKKDADGNEYSSEEKDFDLREKIIRKVLSKDETPTSTTQSAIETVKLETSIAEKINEVSIEKMLNFTENKSSNAVKLYKYVRTIDVPTTAAGLALHAFATGATINPESYSKEVIGGDSLSLNVKNKDKRLKAETKDNNLISKTGKNISTKSENDRDRQNSLAHSIWTNLSEEVQNKVSIQDLENEIINIFGSFNNRFDLAMSFVEKYGIEESLDVQEAKFYEQTYGEEVIPAEEIKPVSSEDEIEDDFSIKPLNMLESAVRNLATITINDQTILLNLKDTSRIFDNNITEDIKKEIKYLFDTNSQIKDLNYKVIEYNNNVYYLLMTKNGDNIKMLNSALEESPISEIGLDNFDLLEFKNENNCS